MVGNEADIRADLELDGSRAVSQLRRVSSEIRRTLRQAAELERTLNQAFGQRTSVTGPRADALRGAAGVARRGSDATTITNSLIQGRAATIRASTPVLQESIRKQNEQLERAIKAPQERLRRAAQESQRSFNNLLGVGDTRLQGTQRAQYERSLDTLLNRRDRSISSRQKVLDGYAQNAQRSFNNILGVGDTRLGGIARTRYEQGLGSLFNSRDKQLQRSERSLRQRAGESQKYYNDILGIGDRRLSGLARTRYESQFSQLIDRRDKELGRAPPASQRLSNEQTQARAEQTRRLRDATLFGDGGRSLFRIQARLLAHYLVLNQIFSAYRFGVGFVVEFDRALQNLQAITVTSNTNMEQLSVSLRQVSRETKFTAVEVAEAATILGQAGFSTTEIQQSIRSITLLAAATGSTLKQAVDVATSTLGVFNLRASEMASVANQITTAINRSKLNIEKLALGLQFAGNVAADAGLGLDELLSSLAQFANAGVRSGSTLGTGIRQLIIDLAAPSRKLSSRYRELGLTTDSVSIKTQGFIGVLRNLRDAGFTGSDALEFLEVRAANAFSAITKGLPNVENFRRALILANSAARANATQMQSLANRWSRFVSVMGEVVLIGSGPIASFFKSLLTAVTTVGIAVAESGKAFTVFTSILLGVGISALTVWVTRVIGLRIGLAGATTATFSLAAATGVLGRALAGVGAIASSGGGIFGALVFTGIGLLTNGFGLLTKETNTAADAQDRAQAQFENTKGRVETLEQSISSINDTIGRLSDREARLNANQGELQTEVIRTQDRFRGLGLVLDSNVVSTQQLLDSLTSLRAELRQGLPGAIESQITSLGTAGEARRLSVSAAQNQKRIQDIPEFLGQFGVGFRGESLRSEVDPRGENRALGLSTVVDEVLQALSGGDNRIQFPENISNQSEIRTLLDTIVRLQFRPDREGSLPEGELVAANRLITQLRGSISQDQSGSATRTLLNQIAVLIVDAQARNAEVRLGENQQQSLTQQLSQSQFQRDQEGFIAPAISSFDRQAQARLVATQQFPDDPVRTQAELDKAVEEIERGSDVLRSSLVEGIALRSRGVAGLRGGLTEQEQAFFDNLFGSQITNLTKAAISKARRFAEDSKQTNRVRTGAQQKVVNRRVTNLVGQINAAGTREEVEALVASGLQGVPEDLLTAAKLNDLFRPIEGAPPGALSERITARLDRLQSVDLPGQPGRVQDDLREASDQESITQLRTFGQSVQRRLSRLESQQTSLEQARLRLNRGRRVDPSTEARELQVSARSALSDIQAPETEFDIRNRGTRGLQGEARVTARLELERTALEASINVYERWVVAHSTLIEELQREVAAREADTSTAKQVLETAEAENDSVQDITKATQALTSAESAETASKKRLAALGIQLIDINRKYNEILITQSSLPEPDLTFIDKLLQSIKDIRSSLQFSISSVAQDFAKAIQQGMSEAIKSFVTGTGTLLDVFRGFVDRVLDIAVNNLANQLTDIILGSIDKGLSGGQRSGGFLSGIFNSFLGGFSPGGGPSSNVLLAQTAGLGLAAGGRISGGTPGQDSVRARLTPDEFVLRASSARSIGYDLLSDLNERGARALGPVTQGGASSIVNQQNGPQQLNVWVVPPEQVPPPSREDVIAYVANDIQRGGSTKKLIKSVQLGSV